MDARCRLETKENGVQLDFMDFTACWRKGRYTRNDRQFKTTWAKIDLVTELKGSGEFKVEGSVGVACNY